MIIGYARVSTQDQNLTLQTSSLKEFGCERIFQEKQSSIKELSQLKELLNILRNGDTVVVLKLDRLGRSLSDLIKLTNLFNDKGVGFISLNDNIDTTTINGRLIFNIFASFAEFEREIIIERTKLGLKRAKENGRIGGRKKGLSPEAKKKAKALLEHTLRNNKLPPVKRESVNDMASIYGISRITFYRYLKWAKATYNNK